jgi:hypothetical protein
MHNIAVLHNIILAFQPRVRHRSMLTGRSNVRVPEALAKVVSPTCGKLR